MRAWKCVYIREGYVCVRGSERATLRLAARRAACMHTPHLPHYTANQLATRRVPLLDNVTNMDYV